MANKVSIEFNEERIRQIASRIRKNAGGFSTGEAGAFLVLYAKQLTDLLEYEATRFITSKLK